MSKCRFWVKKGSPQYGDPGLSLHHGSRADGGMLDLLRDFLKTGPAPPLYGFRGYSVGGGNLLNGFPPDFSFDDIHGLIVPQIKRLYVVLRLARTHFLQKNPDGAVLAVHTAVTDFSFVPSPLLAFAGVLPQVCGLGFVLPTLLTPA